MVNNLASDALYRKYEEEKSLLELYGHVNNLTFENWLDTKKSNKKNIESVIKWQTGEPKAEGYYLVTTNFGHVTFDYWMKKYSEGGSCYDWSLNNGYKKVRAWCKLSDIKPFKEE